MYSNDCPNYFINISIMRIIDESPNKRYLKFNDVIGTGSFKIVNKSFDTNEGIYVAWNMIHLNKIPESMKERIGEEIKLLYEIRFKNKFVMNIHNSWINKEEGIVHFISDLAVGGSLRSFIQNIYHVKIKVIKKWAVQILEGLDFLHNNHIIHRDIKSDNIFIRSDTGNIFIGDFGMAKKSPGDKTHSMIGTPEFMAPEIYEEDYNHKVDLYSFGMCLLELLTGEIPYSECTAIPQIWKKVNGGIKPESIDKVLDENGKKLILECISFNSTDRPTIEEIKNHSFFTDESNNDNMLIYKQFSLDNKKKSTSTLDEFSEVESL